MAHISPAMRAWRQKRAKVAAAAIEMPEPVRVAIETAGRSVWASASEVADQRVKAARDEAKQRVSAAESERDELLREIERLEAVVQGLEAEKAELLEAIEQLRSSESAKDAAIADLRAEIATTTARLDETRSVAEKAEEREKGLSKKLRVCGGSSKPFAPLWKPGARSDPDQGLSPAAPIMGNSQQSKLGYLQITVERRFPLS